MQCARRKWSGNTCITSADKSLDNPRLPQLQPSQKVSNDINTHRVVCCTFVATFVCSVHYHHLADSHHAIRAYDDVTVSLSKGVCSMPPFTATVAWADMTRAPDVVEATLSYQHSGPLTHHELDIVGKYCLYALNHRLWRQVVCDVGHAPWVACVECGGRLVPWGLVIVLHRERLNLETHNASQVSGSILVVQDCESQVVVQEELDFALALK